MTPEERYTRLENFLHALMEHRARQQELIDKHTQQIDKHTEQIDKHTVQIDKNTAGIRDLIVVTRTVLDSIQELREVQRKDHEQMKSAHAATEEKLNILVETVDRIIRRRDSHN